jgi:alcohol dehydrogenase class IV
VLLPYVITYNRPAIESKVAVIARVLDLKGEPFGAFFDWVLAFRRRLRIPQTLADIGVPATSAELIGREAALDPSASGNPQPADAAAYARIFRAAVEGDPSLKG